jgi:oxygen-independent coproporphyrinogen-3 oxidase
MNQTLIERYAAPVPRYTSYPTAPHFHAGIDPDVYAGWLGQIGADTALSLYLHSPFCDRLCWFCGCHTKQVRRYEPVATYLETLRSEIDLVADNLHAQQPVSAIHFGGGSPSMIAANDIDRLSQRLDARFAATPDCEISLEVDPNDISDDILDVWAAFGVTRASLGVQDFDETVQRAINRPQSFERTQAAVEGFRTRGVSSINLDVLYGLPHQTAQTLARTIEQVIALSPDRIALFGYAHVPWMKKHQRMIDQTALPGIVERFELASLGATILTAEGYVAIGIDHFARAGDALAANAGAGRMRRNFQGYTTDRAEVLIGLGASAIGKLPQGYVQNTLPTAEYTRSVLAGRLPVARGIELTPRDRITAAAIESLMCNFSFSLQELQREAGTVTNEIAEIARSMQKEQNDGLVRFDGDCLEVLPAGRPLVRSIAARFDQYFLPAPARHSPAI